MEGSHATHPLAKSLLGVVAIALGIVSADAAVRSILGSLGHPAPMPSWISPLSTPLIFLEQALVLILILGVWRLNQRREASALLLVALLCSLGAALAMGAFFYSGRESGQYSLPSAIPLAAVFLSPLARGFFAGGIGVSGFAPRWVAGIGLASAACILTQKVLGTFSGISGSLAGVSALTALLGLGQLLGAVFYIGLGVSLFMRTQPRPMVEQGA